ITLVSPLFPYTTLFRSAGYCAEYPFLVTDEITKPLPLLIQINGLGHIELPGFNLTVRFFSGLVIILSSFSNSDFILLREGFSGRSEEHTSELQSRENLV